MPFVFLWSVSWINAGRGAVFGLAWGRAVCSGNEQTQSLTEKRRWLTRRRSVSLSHSNVCNILSISPLSSSAVFCGFCHYVAAAVLGFKLTELAENERGRRRRATTIFSPAAIVIVFTQRDLSRQRHGCNCRLSLDVSAQSYLCYPDLVQFVFLLLFSLFVPARVVSLLYLPKFIIKCWEDHISGSSVYL